MSVWTTLFFVALAGAILWLALAAATTFIAHRRGGKVLHWVLLGLLLGPVGLFLVVKHAHVCPHCQSRVLRGIYTCPQCHRDVPRLEENPVGPLWTYRRNW